MNDAQKKKRNFRNSKKWKEFRHKKYVEQKGMCAISNRKLNKMANLHHMDLDDTNYENVSNPDNFVFLNKSMHEAVHAIYRYYSQDESVLANLIDILQRMRKINDKGR